LSSDEEEQHVLMLWPRSWLFLSLFTSALVLSQPANSAEQSDVPLRIESRVKSKSAQVGEPFSVEVLVTHAPNQRYEMNAAQDVGEFDVRGIERHRTDGPGSSTTAFEVSMAAFQLGQQTTPTLKLTLAASGTTTEQTIDVAGKEIDIVSSLPANADEKGENLFDVRSPEALWVRTYRAVYALFVLLALAACAYAVYRYVKRPRAAKALAEVPLLPLHIRATNALDALAQRQLPQQNRGREFYFQLSEILRGYLGERYGFEALESTTPELLAALGRRATPGLPFERLADFAHESDFVRYAKDEPRVEQCHQALQLSYLVVQQTTQVSRAEPEAAKSGIS
jgi:hypothetical protein